MNKKNASAQHPQLIELKLTEIQQLFNSMDPSPFHERDLDHDAEQFILSWAQEFSIRTPLKLLIHLEKAPKGIEETRLLAEESIQHYFKYQADLTGREFRQLMKEGRIALLIGLSFLAVCEFIAQYFTESDSAGSAIVLHGFTVIGWVAMWRPLEIYLYRWWPVLRRQKIFQNLMPLG